MAIAARMPMIRITTRSSIRVKPFSSSARRRSLYEAWSPPGIFDWVCLRQIQGPNRESSMTTSQLRYWWQPGFLHPLEVRGFASRPRERFALGTLSDSGTRSIDTPPLTGVDVHWTLGRLVLRAVVGRSARLRVAAGLELAAAPAPRTRDLVRRPRRGRRSASRFPGRACTRSGRRRRLVGPSCVLTSSTIAARSRSPST